MKRSIVGAVLAALIFNAAWCRASLITHYDASLITQANGTPVLTLTDLSGNGNNAAKSTTAATVGTYVSNGIGGLPSIQFVGDHSDSASGSGNGYQSALSGATFGMTGDAAFTQVFVYRTPGNVGHILSWVGSVGSGFVNHGSSIVEIDNHRFDVAGGFGNDVVLNPGNSFDQLANQNLIVTVVHEGGTGQSILNTTKIYVNGNLAGQGILAGLTVGTTGDAATAALNLANAPFVLGGGPVGTGGGFDGLMSEAFFYNHALTTSERNALESQLGGKYGIAVVPEPTSLVLASLALGGLIHFWRRERALKRGTLSAA